VLKRPLALAIWLVIVDNRERGQTSPPCAAHSEYFRSLSLSKIWLESRLLGTSCSIARQLGINSTRHMAVM